MRIFVRTGGARPLAALLALSFLLSACYTTRPLVAAQPTPGQRVLVRLTDQGSIDLARFIGPGMTAIEGTVTSAADGELGLRVIRTEQRNGVDVTWTQEPVTVPRGAIASIQERSLDKRRSYIFAGGLTALVITIALLIGTGAFSGGSGEGDGPPQ